MTPRTFTQAQNLLAENQPEFLLLPAHQADGVTTTCYEVTTEDIARMILAHRIWVQVQNGRDPIHPQRLSIECPLPESL